MLAALFAAMATPVAAAPLTPLPFHYFCQENPAQCEATAAATLDATTELLVALTTVNRQVNASIKPRRDTGDIWAVSPRFGDCEDYALTKRAALIHMGLPAGALRIATGKTGNESHAVLVVVSGAGLLVLDNLVSDVRLLGDSPFTLTSMSGADPQKWEN